MRSTPLPSGSLTSTMATSKPLRRATASPSSPRAAVMTSMGAVPRASCADVSTARSDPTSSALSSTMSTRPRAVASRATPAVLVTRLSQAEQLSEQGVDDLRIGRASGLFHDLTDEKAHHVRLARTKLFHLLGALFDDAAANDLERRGVADLGNARFLDDVPRVTFGSGGLGVDLLGLLAADRPPVDQAQERCNLRSGDRKARGKPVGLNVSQDLALDEIGDLRRVPMQSGRFFEEGGDARVARENMGRVGAQSHFVDETI